MQAGYEQREITMMKGTKKERFYSKVVVSENENDCWGWNGTKDSKGYGRFSFMYKTIQSHRFSYELFIGKIPEGLVIDHLCRNTSCCNPKHLEPVSIYENCRRGIEALGGRSVVFLNAGIYKIGGTCRSGVHLFEKPYDILSYGKSHQNCRKCTMERRAEEECKIRREEWNRNNKDRRVIYNKRYRASKKVDKLLAIP